MRILYAIHDFLPRHAAGSQVYAFDLARAVARQGHEVRFFTSESREGPEVIERSTGGIAVTEVPQRRRVGRLSDSFSHAPAEEAFSAELAHFRPDVVHYHHLLHLSLSLPERVGRGTPQVMTLHDYFLSCPRGGQRLDWQGEICEQVDLEKCSKCMARFWSEVSLPGRVAERIEAAIAGAPLLGKSRATLSPAPGPLAWAAWKALGLAPSALGLPAKYDAAENRVDLELRGKMIRSVLDRMDRFIAPSAFLARKMREWGLSQEKLLVSDYGFGEMRPSGGRRPGSSDSLRVGYVGTLVPHKGVHHLVEAFRLGRQGRTSLHIYGDPVAFPSYSRRLRARARGLPVVFEGGFAPEDRSAVYSGVDLLVLPSIWWENSPLTIHEAHLSGVPVLVPRHGAFVDLVRDGVDGLFYEPGNPADLARQIGRFCADDGLRANLRPDPRRVKSIQEDAAWTIALYQELGRAKA